MVAAGGSDILSGLRSWYRIVSPLGFAYAALLTCSAIGPAPPPVQDHPLLFSVSMLIPLIVGMLVRGAPWERRPWLDITLGLSAAVSLLAIGLIPPLFRVPLLAWAGFILGRRIARWSAHQKAPPVVSEGEQAMNLAIALQFAYLCVYVSNVVLPSLSYEWSMISPAILAFGSACSYDPVRRSIPKRAASETAATVPEYFVARVDARSAKAQWRFLAALGFVFVGAGFVYAGMPSTFIAFSTIDRFVNVLPLIFTVPLAAWLYGLGKERLVLSVGIVSLALSFVLVQFSATVPLYLTTQLFLQTGWGFLNVLVWSVAAGIEGNQRYRGFQRVVMAIFLFGITAGTMLLRALHDQTGMGLGFTDLIGFFPLLVAILLLPGLPTAYPYRSGGVPSPAAEANPALQLTHLLSDLRGYASLSEREREIALLLARQIPNKEICDTLHISMNTLKTHSRNIYRKLDLLDRKDLKRLVTDRLQTS